MKFLKTIVFHISFILLTIFLGGCGLFLVFFSKKFAFKISRIWSASALWLLNKICGVKCEIEKNYDLPESCIVASKHQSSYETFLLWKFVDNPSYILKKELLEIPIFGTYLKHTGMISIDRRAGRQSMVKILKEGKKSYEANRNLIIFPEGTRTKYGEITKKYSSGIFAVYDSFQKPIVPIALNTGKFWSNFRFIIHPGTVQVKFLPIIKPGLDKERFMKKINHVIESESIKL